MKQIFALLPNLFSRSGHIYTYHLSFESAMLQNGWKYHVYVPKNPQIESLPKHWVKALADDWWGIKKTLLFRCKVLVSNILPFIKIFRTAASVEEGVIFLEHFELQNIGSIFFAGLFCKPLPSFWILHRYAFGKRHFKTKIYQFLHLYLKWKGAKVVLFTDSELLAEEQSIYYKQKVHVLPIPHVKKDVKGIVRDLNLIWWPGAQGVDKGVAKVKAISSEIERNNMFSLLVPNSFQGLFSHNSSIHFIENNLSVDQFSYWMHKAGLLILPYDPTSYARRTSGIFVEAIISGALPIVSKGTWMAYELEKYSLSELTFEFASAGLVEIFSFLIFSREVREKLSKMQRKYESFHSEGNLAVILNSLSFEV